jgi:hypothetical protein
VWGADARLQATAAPQLALVHSRLFVGLIGSLSEIPALLTNAVKRRIE